MEENPVEFPTSQLYTNDWKKWRQDVKKNNESCLVHAYNLVQIWVVKTITFIYNVFCFYFVPFLIILLVEKYGVRPISDDTAVIEAETGNTSLTLVSQEMVNFNYKTDFLKYY